MKCDSFDSFIDSRLPNYIKILNEDEILLIKRKYNIYYKYKRRYYELVNEFEKISLSINVDSKLRYKMLDVMSELIINMKKSLIDLDTTLFGYMMVVNSKEIDSKNK